jgi:thiamine kinase-like enzyme
MFKLFKLFRLKNKSKGDLSSEQFKKLAQDIRELADLIGKIWITNDEFQIKIRKIKKEMDQLDRILDKKYFAILSAEKKQELKKSLIVSKKELLKCIQEAPCPTKRMQ